MSLFLGLFISLSVVLTGCSEESTVENDIEKQETAIEEETDQNEDQGKTDDIGENEEEKESPEETSSDTSKEDNDSNVPDNTTIPATVVRVVDGDTLKATVDGKEETIRLILVDTPETVHPSKTVQPFGPEASDFAKKTLEGKEVGLELDVSERDQYGRILAYVWIGDKMFNEMLLEKGLARVSVFPPDVKYVDRFREIESKARQKGIGIWSIENYATEEGYNETSEKQNNTGSTSEKASANCDDPKIKGNINSSGEKIYHVPGGQFYDVTNPEEMFCTEEEAQAAGYRKSKR